MQKPVPLAGSEPEKAAVAAEPAVFEPLVLLAVVVVAAVGLVQLGLLAFHFAHVIDGAG